MEPSSGVEIKVGLFVVVATLLAIVFIIAFGGNRVIFHSTYRLKMQVDETGGLAIGGIVQVSGVQAGNVVATDFDPQSNKVVVTIKIDKKFQNRITKGSVASIHTQGALGDKFVSIQPGPFAGEPLQNDDFIESEPNTDLLSTLGRSGNRIQKAFDILDNLDRIIRGLNEHNFSENMSATARNLKGTSESLNEIMATIRGPDPRHNKIKVALDHLASVMQKIDDGQGTLGGLINDPTVHEDLKTLLGGAKRSKLLRYLIRQTIQSGEDHQEGKTQP